MKKLIISFLSVSLILIFTYQYYVGALKYVSDPNATTRVVVNVKKGANASLVADQLYQKGLIKSPLIFKFYLKQEGIMNQIKAGRIVVQTNYTLPQIVDALVSGKTEELTVTVLEGWTIKQIADHLEEMGLTTSKEFIECTKKCEFEFNFLPKGYLEGYLYPDTYFVNPESFSNVRFISRMIDTLKKRLSRDWQKINNGKRSFEDIMIMASIIEREERNSKERSTVAGVLWNRFDNNVGLGADATVLYALGRTKGGLTYQDLQIDSPYNTRKYRGLPPTPIANPSVSSIRAALYPKKTDYWYYLHDSDGKVHYAKTLDEHNVNKEKYIKN